MNPLIQNAQGFDMQADAGVPPPAQVPPGFAAQMAGAGLTVPNSDAAPPPTPPPAPPPPGGATFALPPDVAARVAQQNAVADTGPTTVAAPPAQTPITGATPPPAAPPTPAARMAGPSGPPLDPYAAQKKELEGEKGSLVNQAAAQADIAGSRAEALDAGAAENQTYAAQVAAKNANDEAMRAKLTADHADLIKAESGRDLEAEFKAKKSPLRHAMELMSATVGGMLQGWNHLAENPALKAINEQTANYVQQQQQASALKIKGDDNVYQRFLDKTHSEDAAAALTHAAVLDHVKVKLEKSAADTDDLEKRSAILGNIKQIDRQVAQFTDAGTVARARAAAAAGPAAMAALKESVGLRKEMAETAKTQAETEALQNKGAGPAAALAGPANAVLNGPQLGPLDRLAAPYAGEHGAARAFLGDNGNAANANLQDLIVASMPPGARKSPEAIQQWGKTHGAYSDPVGFAERERTKARNPLQADASATKGASDYEGAEEQ